MDYVEKTVKANYIYKGKILNLRVDDAELPNGKPCKREIIEHSGGACVLCVKEDKVLLVRQYRYAYGESVYEIPAGKIDKGEDPQNAAIRELEEEGGLIATEIKHLFTLYPTPGYTNERIYVYQATAFQEGKVHLDEGEFLTAEFVSLDEVVKMLERGEIRDAKTVVAIQAYLLSQK